jgi:hypothetical protein
MFTVIAHLKDGTACYRSALLTTRNQGRTQRPGRAWWGTQEAAMAEASRLNGTFLESHTDVLFYSEGRLPGRRACPPIGLFSVNS